MRVARPIGVKGLLLLWLAACSGPGPGAAPPVPPLPPPPPFSRIGEAPVGAFRFVVPLPERPSFEWGGLVGNEVLLTDDGRVFRLDGARVVALPDRAAPPAPPPAFRVEDGAVVRTADGRRYPLPDPALAPRLIAADGRGDPVLVHARGGVLVWSENRREMVHTSEPDGTRMYFEQLEPPAFEGVGGTLPREVIGVAGTERLLLLGRDGEVAAVERDWRPNAVPVIAVPRPRTLAIAPLADGSLLVAAEDGIRRVAADGRAEPLPLPPAARAWLAARPRQSPSLGLPLLQAVALEDGRVLFAGGPAFLVAGGEPPPRFVDLVALGAGEVVTAARDSAAGFAVLTHIARVIRPDAAPLALHPAGFMHVTGLFTGGDGRPRVVEDERPLGCVLADSVEGCGPIIDAERRLTHPLADGLVLEDQRIRTLLVTDTGLREIPDPIFPGDPSEHRALFAGSSGALYVMQGDAVARLDGERWVPVGRLPLDGQCLAVAPDGRLLVGAESGAILEHRP